MPLISLHWHIKYTDYSGPSCCKSINVICPSSASASACCATCGDSVQLIDPVPHANHITIPDQLTEIAREAMLLNHHYNATESDLLFSEGGPVLDDEGDEDRARVEATEALGLQHLLAMLENTELFKEIAANDWEDIVNVDEDLGEGHEGHAGEEPVTPHQPLLTPQHDSELPASMSLPFLHEYNPRGENSPDPFEQELSQVNLPPTPENVHPIRTVYIIYVLVIWLHTQFHLAFRACNAILVVFALALQSIGAVVDLPMYRTLPTLLERLNVEVPFQILPVCPSCHEVHPSSVPGSQQCLVCQHALFNTTPTAGEERRGCTSHEKPKLLLQFLTKSLAEQLATMLMVPGIEDEMARSLQNIRRHVPGIYTNIFDGKICRELKAADGTKFFSPSEEVIAAGKLRIGVTLGVDWWVISFL